MKKSRSKFLRIVDEKHDINFNWSKHQSRHNIDLQIAFVNNKYKCYHIFILYALVKHLQYALLSPYTVTGRLYPLLSILRAAV